MILVILTALLAVSEAAHIEKRYLFNSRRSGGLFGSADVESPAVPSGGYTNDALGVVVDAVAPGIRTSGVEPTGLGGPRTSYGSLNSKVGDAAFKIGGGVKGTASGIGSLFGFGTDQGAYIGLPGIGFDSGSSSLDVAEKRTTSAKVTVLKTTYESIHSADGDVGLGVGNAARKEGAIGSSSIFGSGSSQSNLGLPSIGFGFGSSSLDASGVEATDTKATGFGVSKTTYESKPFAGRNGEIGVESVVAKADAIRSGSIFGSSSSQANLGLPGFGFGSTTLDASGNEATNTKATSFGVSTTTYESKADGNVRLGVENAARKEGAIGSSSIFGSSSSQSNLGLSGIGFGFGSSSLNASGIEATDTKATGFGVSKTTYESKPVAGRNGGIGVESAVVEANAIRSGSIFGSSSSQANLELPGIGFGSGSSTLDASGNEATSAKASSFGVAKTKYESIPGGDVTLGAEKTVVKEGATGSGSIISSGLDNTNVGLPGIGIGSGFRNSGSISLDASGIETTDAKFTGIGVSKTSYESIQSTGDEAQGDKKATVKGNISGSGSIFNFGSDQASEGLPSIGIGSRPSSLDASAIVANDANFAGFGKLKDSYESSKTAVKEDTIGVGSIFGSGKKVNLEVHGSGDVIKSSDVNASIDVSKVSHNTVESTSGGAVFGVGNAELKESDTAFGSLFVSGKSQNANKDTISGSSSIEAAAIKTAEVEILGHSKSKTSIQTIPSKDVDSALTMGNQESKGNSAGIDSLFSQDAKLGVTGTLPTLDVLEKVSGSKVTGFGVPKTANDSTGGNAVLNLGKTELKGVSMFDSVKGQVVSEKMNSEAVKDHEDDKKQVQKFDTKEIFNTERSDSGVSTIFGSSQKVNISSLGAGEGYANNKIYAQKFSNEARINADAAISGPTNVFSGVINVFSDGSRQKANSGLTGVDFVSGISSLGPAKGCEHDKVHAQNVGLSTHEGVSEIAPVFDSSKKVDAELPSFGVRPGPVSSKTVEGYEDDKIYAHKFANNAALSAKASATGIASDLGSSKKKVSGNLGFGLAQGFISSKTVEGYEDDKIYAQKFANNAALSAKASVTGIASDLGSSKKEVSGNLGFGLGQGVISSKTVEGYENDKIHAQQFAKNAVLSAKGDASGLSSVFGTGSSQKFNVKVPNISASSASGVKASGTELTSFDVSKTSHSLIGSKIEETAITTANAGLKVDAADVDTVFGSSIGQKLKLELPGIGIVPEVSSSVGVIGGYENDESHAQKFEVNSDISTKPRPIAVETLTSQKQNVKEGFISQAHVGSYNVQNNNDKSGYSKCNGEGNEKLSVNSGDSGSIAVQSSIGNGQSLSSLGQPNKNKFIGFGLNGQIDTQNKQVLLHDNTQHFGVHSEKHGGSDVFNQRSSVSTVTSTSSVGVPTPGQQGTSSTNGNDGISSTFGSEKSSELSSFIGKGEIFGGPRDPPSFDIKTGYHY